MIKADIISQLSDNTGLTQQQATAALEGIMDIMKQSMTRRESIFLRGFGTFKIVERKGTYARDISRGKQIVIPPHHAVVFKPGEELKKKVR